MGIIRKLKNIEPAKLNKIRFWLFSIALFLVIIGSLSQNYYEHVANWLWTLGDISYGLAFILSLLLLGFIIYKRDTVSNRFIIYLFAILCLSISVHLIVEYSDLRQSISNDLYWFLRDVSGVTLVAVFILTFFHYLTRSKLVILGLIIVIIIGLILNRIGLRDFAEGVIIMAFGALTIIMIYVGVRSFHSFTGNRFVGRLFFALGLILAFCSTIFMVKYLTWEAAHTGTADFLGVIVFLTACLILFAAMPFTHFIEWTNRQKSYFYRLFLIPMIFFLVLFSMKFFMPGSYQKLFFKGFAEKEKVYFGMEKYELEETEDEVNK